MGIQLLLKHRAVNDDLRDICRDSGGSFVDLYLVAISAGRGRYCGQHSNANERTICRSIENRQ